MTTTELIDLFKKYEYGGATGRPREVMFCIGNKIYDTNITDISTSDGLFTELFLKISTQPNRVNSIDHLNTQKPRRPSNKEWILVTEETPPEETDVIVTIQDDSGDRPFRYTATAWYFKGTWVGNNEIIHNVIAWMPLPKHY